MTRCARPRIFRLAARLRDANAVARIVAVFAAWSRGIPETSQCRQWRDGDADRLWSRLSRLLLHRGSTVVILLCGGDKRTQPRDIKRAHRWRRNCDGEDDTLRRRRLSRHGKRQVAYIAAALESGDADFVRDALGIVARARGMGEVAKNAGLNRESLYKALGGSGNPEFGTVMRIVRALGLTLSARPAEKRRVSKRRRAA